MAQQWAEQGVGRYGGPDGAEGARLERPQELTRSPLREVVYPVDGGLHLYPTLAALRSPNGGEQRRLGPLNLTQRLHHLNPGQGQGQQRQSWSHLGLNKERNDVQHTAWWTGCKFQKLPRHDRSSA